METKNFFVVSTSFVVDFHFSFLGISLSDFQAVMLHCPFSKLVQKGFGRLVYKDYMEGLQDSLVEPELLDTIK